MLRSQFTGAALLAFAFLKVASPIRAQEPTSNGTNPETGKSTQTVPLKDAGGAHRFFDAENAALFTAVAAARALDYTSTQHFRERGVNEALLTNGIVDNKPLFAAIEAGGTAASVGVAYLLHRKGHHRLERWVSIVHIGVATFGDIRNYGLSNPRFAQSVHSPRGRF